MSREGSPLTSGAGEGHQDVEFRSHALAVEPAQKPKQGVQRASGLFSTWRFGKNGGSEDGMEAPRSSPYTLPSAFLPSGCS